MAFQYGEEQICYFVAETTLGTGVKPAGTDAFKITDCVITPNYDFHDVPDRHGTRSRMEQVQGRKGASWRCSGVLRPSGALGTAPDMGLLLKHGYGTETVVGGTSVTYSVLKDPTALFGTFYRKLDDILEGVVGAVVQTVSFRWGGNDFCTWEISGIGVDILEAGKDAANGSGSTSASLIVDDADFYEPYGIIQIDSDDNSGSGFQITAVNKTTETLTITPTHTWSDNDVVEPFVPAGTFAGSPIYGTTGKLSFDGDSTEVKHIGGSHTLNTGIGLHNEEFGSETAQAVILPSERTMDFTLDMLVRDTEAYRMGLFRRDVAQDVYVTLGDDASGGAAARMKIDMPTARIRPAERSGGAGLVRVSLSGVALGTGTGENEGSLLFD